MDSIYSLLEEVPFVHDFSSIHYEAPEFDGKVGAQRLRTVRKELRAGHYLTILPEYLFNRFANHSFWRNPRGFRRTSGLCKKTASSQSMGYYPDNNGGCGV